MVVLGFFINFNFLPCFFISRDHRFAPRPIADSSSTRSPSRGPGTMQGFVESSTSVFRKGSGIVFLLLQTDSASND